jgi:hypothetical protein
MRENRKRADWPLVIGVLLVVLSVALGLYSWGYFALGRATQDNLGDRVRVYDQNWLVTLYGPAAKVERYFIGDDVWLRGPD